MKGKIETVYLGSKQKTSGNGRPYVVVSFLDDGEPCTALLSGDYKGALPDVVTECVMTIEVCLGRYQKITVVDIETL